MEKMVYKAIIRYLKKHYPDELYKIVKRAKEIFLNKRSRRSARRRAQTVRWTVDLRGPERSGDGYSLQICG